VRIGLHFFFRKFQSKKLDNSVEKGPIIFAPTHQNAFMDALAIVMTQPRTSYFLTQAKVFQSKLGNAFFSYIYMLPIYRERDGLHTVKRNQKIINQCIDVLVDGRQPVTIFPEGNHNLRRSLRPLQKGIARIAFGVLDKDPNSNLRICPVGINYSAHRKFRSDLFVFYGEPLEVKPFYATYLENNNKGYIELLDALAERMRPLMHDMPKGLRFHPIKKAWVEHASGTFDLRFNFDQNQKLLAALEDDKLDEIPPKKVSDTPKWVKIIASPFWIWMKINNFISGKMVRTLTKKLAADPAFESSMDLVFGMFLSIFVYLIQAVIIGFFTSFSVGLIYFLSIPIMNWLYLKIYRNHFVVK
jgi:1-acyl-sn-glycerol-3-phosphate acyltransferase